MTFPDPIIHIGYQKTGTTFLQQKIFTRQNGFHLLWSVHTGEAIEYFVHHSKPQFDPQKIAQQYRDETSSVILQGLQPIISHENLCGPNFGGYRYEFDVADRLKKCFPTAKIIIGVREQKSLIQSLYLEYIRHGGTVDIFNFLGCDAQSYQRLSRAGFRAMAPLEAYDYTQLIDYYAGLFGAENILVLPLEGLRQQKQAYLDSLLDFCGITSTSTANSQPANTPLANNQINNQINNQASRPALSVAAATMMRHSNAMFQRRPNDKFQQKRLSLMQRLRLKVIVYLSKLTPHRLESSLKATLKLRICLCVHHFYRDTNKRLKLYFPKKLTDIDYDQ